MASGRDQWEEMTWATFAALTALANTLTVARRQGRLDGNLLHTAERSLRNATTELREAATAIERKLQA